MDENGIEKDRRAKNAQSQREYRSRKKEEDQKIRAENQQLKEALSSKNAELITKTAQLEYLQRAVSLNMPMIPSPVQPSYYGNHSPETSTLGLSIPYNSQWGNEYHHHHSAEGLRHSC
ncbi:hypothetical protein FRC18_005059 [Serendipita sp. 400]|nr:hypothetical protein FRC18_005059 [Serendipita sp. 400]